MRRLVAIIPVAGALALGGCQPGLQDERQLPELDEAYFRCRVQPILTKSCAAFACHGDPYRYFTLFARNRLRSGGDESERNTFMRIEERAFNLTSSLAYVDPVAAEDSLLLRKPLDQSAGGFYHGGAVTYGAGDVFLATDEAAYQTILDWIGGASEDPNCLEPGENL